MIKLVIWIIVGFFAGILFETARRNWVETGNIFGSVR